MTYGTSSIDFGKAVVLLSCGFNVLMIVWIARDPLGVIHSPYAGGWWDALKEEDVSSVIHHDDDVDDRVAIYPRIWATFLALQVVIRVNWVLTVETAPALYRCVLMSYALPLAQYACECWVFRTLPPADVTTILLLTVPWLTVLVQYPKYTQSPSGSSSSHAAGTRHEIHKPDVKRV